MAIRRSIKLLPGVRLNVGTRGASVTIGNRFARTTISRTHTTRGASLPGTGLSHCTRVRHATAPAPAGGSVGGGRVVLAVVAGVAVLLAVRPWEWWPEKPGRAVVLTADGVRVANVSGRSLTCLIGGAGHRPTITLATDETKVVPWADFRDERHVVEKALRASLDVNCGYVRWLRSHRVNP